MAPRGTPFRHSADLGRRHARDSKLTTLNPQARLLGSPLSVWPGLAEYLSTSSRQSVTNDDIALDCRKLGYASGRGVFE